MPIKSEAQRRWAHANKDKPGRTGRAARKYAKSDTGGRKPARVGRKGAKS